MKRPLNPKPNPTKRKFSLFVVTMIGLVLIVALVWISVTLLHKSSGNYAQDTAKPLEDALIKAGGMKRCSIGDNGRGSDNNRPNYESFYQLNINKDNATNLINKIAKDNGFTLSHEDSPYNSIEWYSDKTTKENGYPELVGGKVILIISTYNDTSKQVLTCPDGTALLGDNAHTAISLTVNLPAYKR